MPRYRVTITQFFVNDEIFEADNERLALDMAEEHWYGGDWEGNLDSHETEIVEVHDVPDYAVYMRQSDVEWRCKDCGTVFTDLVYYTVDEDKKEYLCAQCAGPFLEPDDKYDLRRPRG